MKRHEILLADDEPLILSGMSAILELEGYAVTTAESGEKAVDLLLRDPFDLVMTDLVMGEMDGIEVLKAAKQTYSDIMVIIFTGYGDLTSAIEALRCEADDYLLKPFEPETMTFTVAKCLEKLEFKRKIRLYESILPVCCVCKRIRDDLGKEPNSGEWLTLEQYMSKRAGLRITHGYCPRCYEKALKEIEEE